MAGLVEMVKKSLLDSGADSETLELWESVTEWYEEGGPDAVEEGIGKKLKGIRSIASKQLKETKEAIPKTKKRKNRR
jgi:hypothetical protein